MVDAVTLSTCSNTHLRQPTIEDSRDAHPQPCAAPFIDDNAHQDLTPIDIAITPKALVRSAKLAFRRR